MNGKIICLILIVFILTFSIASSEEEVLRLNLESCIDMAMKTDVDIITAEQNLAIAVAQKKQALSGFYPTVGMSGAYSRTDQGSTTVSGITASTTSQSHFLAYGISQTVFDSFQTWYSYKYALLEIKQQEYALQDAKATLALSVSTAYFDVINAKYLMDLDRLLLEQSLKHLEQAAANYEAGISPKSDVFSAEVDVTNSKVTLLESQGNFKTKMAKLKNYIGIKREVKIELEENFYEMEEDFLLDDAINNALSKRPDLMEAEVQVEAQDKQLDILNLDRYPSLSIDVGFYSEITKYPTDPENYYTISASLSIPIFDGFNVQSQIEQAEAYKVIYEAQKADLMKTISLDVETAYYDLETALAKIQLTSQQVQEAEKNLNISEGRYEAGIGSFQEVLDAKVSYSQAMNNFVSARYDYQTALFTFKKAIGEELL